MVQRCFVQTCRDTISSSPFSQLVAHEDRWVLWNPTLQHGDLFDVPTFIVHRELHLSAKWAEKSPKRARNRHTTANLSCMCESSRCIWWSANKSHNIILRYQTPLPLTNLRFPLTWSNMMKVEVNYSAHQPSNATQIHKMNSHPKKRETWGAS